MDLELRHHFIQQWRRYFPGTGLPLVVYYHNDEPDALRVQPGGSHCLIAELARVRNGESIRFDAGNVACGGGRYYLGFTEKLRPQFNEFLSCGIPGVLEGERYKETPELAEAMMNTQPAFRAPARQIVFKRYDRLTESDDPQVVIFFTHPDALAGLFTLANFDEQDPQAVIAPFGSGCASIIKHPFVELQNARPRAVLGMFDISARPAVEPGMLTLAVPWPKFIRMAVKMDHSFLGTASWDAVRRRMG